MSEPLLLSGGTIFTPHEEIHGGMVVCESGRIKAVLPEAKAGANLPCRKIDPSGMMICPGLIDIHLHGALGIDFLDAGTDDLDRILRFHTTRGTTSLLPTLMSAPLDHMTRAIERILLWQKGNDRKGMIRGIHLEGPFLSPDQTGIHNREDILYPDKDTLLHLIQASRGKLSILTLAPELEGAMALIRLARENGIIVSAGHSVAGYEEMQEAIDQGLNHVCHCFNAMGRFHHREPGVIGAVLNTSRVTAELILDGIHVHPAVAHILIQMLGVGNVILVTDCSPLVGLKEGVYLRDIQDGRKIFVKRDVKDNIDVDDRDMRHVENGRIADLAGRLAGSALSLTKAIKNCLDFGLVSLPQAISMATANPSRLLHLDQEIGFIRPGFRADMTIMDRDFKTRMVVMGGEIVYTDLQLECVS